MRIHKMIIIREITMTFSQFKFSRIMLLENVRRSVRRICVLTLTLTGLTISRVNEILQKQIHQPKQIHRRDLSLYSFQILTNLKTDQW